MSAGVESLQLRLEATFDGPIDTHHRSHEGEVIIWRRLHHLGSGAFGTVWKEQRVGSETDRHDTVRAVKQSPKRHRRAWKRELQAMCRFSQHTEHFVHCLGWFESTDHLYIAMEFVPHGTLQAHIIRRPLPEHETVLVMTQLAQAVAYMHKANFLHRDLKPLNVLVNHPGPDWHVKVADFGTSNELSLGGKSTIDLMGTMGFVAPEVLLAESGKYTSAVDVWSLGAIAYCLLTKKPPFPSYTDIVKYATQGGEFPIQALRKRRCSFFCEDFTQRLMKVDRAERPTIDQVMADTWLAPHSDEDDTASDEDWRASKRWTDSSVSPNQNVHTVAQSSSVASVRVDENSLRASAPHTSASVDAITVAVNTRLTQHDTIHEDLEAQLVSSQDFGEVARDTPQLAKGASSISPKGFGTFDYHTPKPMLKPPHQHSSETVGGTITLPLRRELSQTWDCDLLIHEQENQHEPLIEVPPLADSASMPKSDHGDAQESQLEAFVQNSAAAQSTPVSKFEHEDGSAIVAQAVQERGTTRRDVPISSKHSARSKQASPPGTHDSDENTDPMIDSTSRADLLAKGPLEAQHSSFKQNQEDYSTVFPASCQGVMVEPGHVADQEEQYASSSAPRGESLPAATMSRDSGRNPVDTPVVSQSVSERPSSDEWDPLSDQVLENDVEHRERNMLSARKQIMEKRMQESVRPASSHTFQADAEQQALDKVTSLARLQPNFQEEAVRNWFRRGLTNSLLKGVKPASKWLATNDRNSDMPKDRGYRIPPDKPQRRQQDANDGIIHSDDSDDESQTRRIRSQMSSSYNGPSQLDQRKRQNDRKIQLAAVEGVVMANIEASYIKAFADNGKLPPARREQRAQHVEKAVKSEVTQRNTTTGRSYQQKGSDIELTERHDIDHVRHTKGARAQMPHSVTGPLKSQSAHSASTSMHMVVPENDAPTARRRGYSHSADDDSASEMSGSESPSSYTKGGLAMTDEHGSSSSGIDEESFPRIRRERSRKRRERGLRPTDENGVVPRDNRGLVSEQVPMSNVFLYGTAVKPMSVPLQRIRPVDGSSRERKVGLFARMKRTMKNL